MPDSVDRCPDQPGAPSTDPARNDCPGMLHVLTGQVRIHQQIFFATDSDRILPRSNALLLSVASALRATPAIHRLAIEGHTDNRGADEHNRELSQHRAESVLRWLTAHGVEASRLEAHGYGPSRPIASNDTPVGRGINRRVEFHITDPQGMEEEAQNLELRSRPAPAPQRNRPSPAAPPRPPAARRH